MVKTLLTENDIRAAFQDGIIRLIRDPNLDQGTVCAIGDSWFYFGGLTAEEMNPTEYAANIAESDIVKAIKETLDEFETESNDEYKYYMAVLREWHSKKDWNALIQSIMPCEQLWADGEFLVCRTNATCKAVVSILCSTGYSVVSGKSDIFKNMIQPQTDISGCFLIGLYQ